MVINIICCRQNSSDFLIPNPYGNLIPQNDNIKAIRILVAFSANWDFVADGISPVDWLILQDIQAAGIIIEFFKDIASCSQIIQTEGCFFCTVCHLFCNCFYNAACRSHIGYTVNQNQFTQCLMLCKQIYNNAFCQQQFADGNFILM